MLRLSSALKDQEGAKKATCETLISFFFLKTGFKYRCLKFVCVCVLTRLRSLPQVECCHLSIEVKSFGWLRLLPVKRAMTLGPGGPVTFLTRETFLGSLSAFWSEVHSVCPASIVCLSFCKENANERALDWRVVTCSPSSWKSGCQKLKECVCVLFFAFSALHRFQGHGPQ